MVDSGKLLGGVHANEIVGIDVRFAYPGPETQARSRMTNATFETLMSLIDGLRAQSAESAMIRAVASPERELEAFLHDLSDVVREEIVALMCLGQEARKNRAYLKNGDALEADKWKPAHFDTYRVEARRYTFDYFASKPLHEYIPLAVEVVKLYEMDTRCPQERGSDTGKPQAGQLPLFQTR